MASEPDEQSSWSNTDDSAVTPDRAQEIDFVTLGMFILGMLLVCYLHCATSPPFVLLACLIMYYVSFLSLSLFYCYYHHYDFVLHSIYPLSLPLPFQLRVVKVSLTLTRSAVLVLILVHQPLSIYCKAWPFPILQRCCCIPC